MTQRWRCAGGHEWERLAQAAPSACPLCGAPPAVMDTKNAAYGETLALPTDDPRATPPHGEPVVLPLRKESGTARLSREQPSSTYTPPEQPEPMPDQALFAETLAYPRHPDDNAVIPDTPRKRLAEQSGLRIQNYEVLGEIGRGGMGVVYKARHVHLNRMAALKMILAGQHASLDDLERFTIEAKAVAQLQHPNIVQLYEVGEYEGRPFFALEYIDGGSLDDKLGGKPMPNRPAAQLLDVLARAMDYAHRQGIVHRDLKPANVLLTTDMVPKITDFGLAKSLEAESGQTGTGTILGTPSYMAPEQALGISRNIGAGADIYALGSMLYELLTGRPPFMGQTILDTLAQVRNDDPVPLRRLQPSVPADLETICLKCLQKEPERRYATALELAEDLQRFLEGLPILARPITYAEHMIKWARRRPAVAVLLVLLAVVLGVSFFGVTGAWLQAETMRVTAEEARDEVVAQQNTVLNARAEAIAQRNAAVDAKNQALHSEQLAVLARAEAQRNYYTAKRSLYVTQLSLAQKALLDGRRERAQQILASLSTPDAGAEDLRSFEWYYLWRLCHSNELSLRGHTSLVTQVAFSADGRYLASASLDLSIKIWNPLTGQELATLRGHERPIRHMAFSPDGRQLASAAADGGIYLWNVRTGEIGRKLAGHAHAVRGVAYRADGQQLASGSDDGSICLWDLSDGKRVSTLRGHPYPVTCVAYSPDGKQLASGSEDMNIKVWDLMSGLEQTQLRGHSHWVTCLAYNHNGKQLVSGSWDNSVRLWDLTGQELPRVLTGHKRALRNLSFRADGKKLASADMDGTVKVWDLLSPRAEPRSLEGRPDLVRTVAFSSDGEMVASVSFDAKVEDLTPTYTSHASPVFAARLLKDRRTVASVGAARDAMGELRGELRIWSLASRADAAPARLFPALARALATSGDGKWLAVAGEDGNAYLCPLQGVEPATEVHRLQGHMGRILSVAFSGDNRLLATASADKTIMLWDVATLRLRATLRGHKEPVQCLAFQPKGGLLASASADRTIKLWDVATGSEERSLTLHQDGVLALAFRHDGKVLASGGADQAIGLWDVATGARLLHLQGHTDAVRALLFTPDGSRLLSGSDDHTLKVWDPITGQETLTLRGHRDSTTCLEMTADGRTLLSSSVDQGVRVWLAGDVAKK